VDGAYNGFTIAVIDQANTFQKQAEQSISDKGFTLLLLFFLFLLLLLKKLN
jgi:hypothetical protein